MMCTDVDPRKLRGQGIGVLDHHMALLDVKETGTCPQIIGCVVVVFQQAQVQVMFPRDRLEGHVCVSNSTKQ